MDLNVFKLEKLKIKAYKARGRSTADWVGDFEAMFNPETFSRKYAIQYGRGQGLNSSDQQATYSRSEPSDLKLMLVLDGSGVSEMGILQLGPQKKVSDRIQEFLNLTFEMNGEIHEPNYLTVEWGDLTFSCRLESVDITYTNFEHDGTPLRAELDVSLISDTEAEKRLAQENQSSPDLTHSRVVRSGDTLPLLTQEIYGSSAYYLRVAQVNNLDNFRRLNPGQEIIFPPLDK
jgi:hypothetical protein